MDRFPIKRDLKGFTLIELLVVIAIIAILAAILFPVFARARENARRAACLSNLKQIGLGIMMYSQDYDEHYPVQTNYQISNYATSASPNWIVEIQPYVKSWQLFVCPSATDATSGAPSGNSKTNYLGNGVVLQRSLSLAAIDSPASIILASEISTNSYWSFLRPGSSDMTASPPKYSYWIYDSNYSNLHFDGGNLLFADGHVKWRKQSSICAVEFGLTAPAGIPACGVAHYSLGGVANF
jgi:prepilin-type N-terminal cleavage/methylation domain-containing protein/prepilin-type processing-associated H-X9-DG protein